MKPNSTNRAREVRATIRRIEQRAGGLTRLQTAAVVGVDPSTIWRWLTGRSRPSRYQIERLRVAAECARKEVTAPQ